MTKSEMGQRNFLQAWHIPKTGPQNKTCFDYQLDQSKHLDFFRVQLVYSLNILDLRIWLVVSTLLKNMKVSWAYYSKYTEQ